MPLIVSSPVKLGGVRGSCMGLKIVRARRRETSSLVEGGKPPPNRARTSQILRGWVLMSSPAAFVRLRCCCCGLGLRRSRATPLPQTPRYSCWCRVVCVGSTTDACVLVCERAVGGSAPHLLALLCLGCCLVLLGLLLLCVAGWAPRVQPPLRVSLPLFGPRVSCTSPAVGGGTGTQEGSGGNPWGKSRWGSEAGRTGICWGSLLGRSVGRRIAIAVRCCSDALSSRGRRVESHCRLQPALCCHRRCRLVGLMCSLDCVPPWAPRVALLRVSVASSGVAMDRRPWRVGIARQRRGRVLMLVWCARRRARAVATWVCHLASCRSKCLASRIRLHSTLVLGTEGASIDSWCRPPPRCRRSGTPLAWRG